MPAGYRVLPFVYDRWQKIYGKDYSTLILPKLLRTLRAYRIPKSTMVDIACGTGTLALLMARRGWRVVGVDASAGMLAEAVKKPEGPRDRVTFLRQDMRSFRLSAPVDVATCLFDSLNHVLSAGGLLRAFAATHRALLPGGYFIFDMNNELCFRQLWTSTQAVHHSDFMMVLENSFSAAQRLAQSRVSVFLKQGGRYVQKNETVRERWYPDQEVAALLTRAGFRVIESERFSLAKTRDADAIKTWWVARK